MQSVRTETQDPKGIDVVVAYDGELLRVIDDVTPALPARPYVEGYPDLSRDDNRDGLTEAQWAYTLATAVAPTDWHMVYMLGKVLEKHRRSHPLPYVRLYHKAALLTLEAASIGTIHDIQSFDRHRTPDIIECHYRLHRSVWKILKAGDGGVDSVKLLTDLMVRGSVLRSCVRNTASLLYSSHCRRVSLYIT